MYTFLYDEKHRDNTHGLLLRRSSGTWRVAAQPIDHASVGENHALVPVRSAGQLRGRFAPPAVVVVMLLLSLLLLLLLAWLVPTLPSRLTKKQT